MCWRKNVHTQTVAEIKAHLERIKTIAKESIGKTLYDAKKQYPEAYFEVERKYYPLNIIDNRITVALDSSHKIIRAYTDYAVVES